MIKFIKITNKWYESLPNTKGMIFYICLVLIPYIILILTLNKPYFFISIIWPYMTTTNVNWDNGGFFNGYNNIFYSTSGIIDNRSKSNTLGDLILCSSITKSIETGRVESGDISNQKFETVNMDFDSCVLTSVVVHMLPESRKPVEVTKKAISPSDASNFVELIKKLGELHSAGLLTDEEFKSKKSELLARI